MCGGPGEPKSFAGAEMVAIDLVGARRVALDDQRTDIGADVEVAAPVEGSVGEGGGGDRAERAQVEPFERDRGQRLFEREPRHQLEGPTSEEGVGVGVHHHAEEPGREHLASAVDESQRRVAPVDSTHPGVDGGVDEEGMAGPPFPRAPSFDLFDDGGVEPHATVEQEVAAFDRAEPDALDVAGVESFEEDADRIDTVVGQSQDAGEDIGRAAGKGRQGGVGAGETVRCFVERAVAAEHDDEVVVLSRGRLGEPGRVTAAAGLGHRDVVIGRQCLVDHDATTGGDRRGDGIDDEEDPQDRPNYLVRPHRHS